MSDFDVYESDMPRRTLTQSDVELLFDRPDPERADLARFAAVLERLHRTAPSNPSDEAIATFSLEAAEIALTSQGLKVDVESARRPHSYGLVTKRLAGALGAAVLVVGVTGVAVADDAVPGDALYGLDRAMESIGVGDSGPTERIAEAQALFETGRVIEAIEHAAEAVQASPESAVDALRQAADRVEIGQGNADNPAVKAAVAGILNEIAAMLEADDVPPAAFGARISEMARSIGRLGGNEPGNVVNPTPGSGGETPGSDDEAQGGQPNTPTGPPDDPGRPDGTPGGPPDDAPGRGRP